MRIGKEEWKKRRGLRRKKIGGGKRKGLENAHRLVGMKRCDQLPHSAVTPGETLRVWFAALQVLHVPHLL